MHELVASGVSVSDPDEQRHIAAVLLDEPMEVALLRRRRPTHQLVHHRRHRHWLLAHDTRTLFTVFVARRYT